MGKSNKKAKEELIRLYGEECFIDKLKLRPTSNKYTSKGQYKKMKMLTFHHIVKREHGGKSTVENGALLSAENHAWFNKQPLEAQNRMNNIFQEYKLGILEMNNGQIIQNQVIKLDFDLKEYDIIPLQPDDRIYNRAKVKQETQNAIDKYFKGGEKCEER